MTDFQAFILGIVQGLTEFLPISSSGHLVLVPKLLQWDIPPDQAFAFDVLVQLGTLVAVIAYFWKDLKEIVLALLKGLKAPETLQEGPGRLGLLVLLGTLPAAVLGLMFKNQVEAAFSNPKITALLLLVTALMMIFAEKQPTGRKALNSMPWKDSLWVGLAQAFALFPGISRSGATISAAMGLQYARSAAARFSFLLSVPVMLAAGFLAGIDLLTISGLQSFWSPLLIGFVTAALVGYLAIHWLLRYLSRAPLYNFSIYLILLGTLLLVWK